MSGNVWYCSRSGVLLIPGFDVLDDVRGQDGTQHDFLFADQIDDGGVLVGETHLDSPGRGVENVYLAHLVFVQRSLQSFEGGVGQGGFWDGECHWHHFVQVAGCHHAALWA